MAVKVNYVQMSILVVLFIGFLCVEQISSALGRSLDLLPIRIAAVLLILGSLYIDKYVSLATFLFIAALYIDHHHIELSGVSVTPKEKFLDPFTLPKETTNLKSGTQASEDYETVDYTPQKEDQENDFTPAGPSQNEKTVLQTEMLGSKAQALFPSSMRHAEALTAGNRDGNTE